MNFSGGATLEERKSCHDHYVKEHWRAITGLSHNTVYDTANQLLWCDVANGKPVFSKLPVFGILITDLFVYIKVCIAMTMGL